MSGKKPEIFPIRGAMDAFKVYIPFIEKKGLNHDIITAIIKEHETVKAQMKYLQDRYDVSKDGVPILDRVLTTGRGNPIEVAINNKLNNTYDSDVVDTKNGYFLGYPINYAFETSKVKKADTLLTAIDQMRTRDNLPDKDSTFGKRASICGYSARLCYMDIENDKPVPRITNLKGDEVVFFYKEAMSEPTYSMHYYDTVRMNDAAEKENVTIVDFYDQTNLYRYVKSDGDFVLEEQNIHGFQYNPLFGLENNDELAGEAQKVLNLIDAFDRTFSDASNEIEASRLAILLLYNLGLDEEDIEKLNLNGFLEIFGEGNAKYLTKDVNDTMIENHLNRLNKSILRFAKSVDFTDENFSSNLSGISILFKTMSLEHKAINSENKMRSSLQYQMKVLCSAWSLLGICDPEDYLNIWFGFKRNLPNNITDAAQATVALKGNVSERTRLSLLPFVDDVEAELEAMRQDREEFADILMPLNTLGALRTNEEETGGSGSSKEEKGATSKEVTCPVCQGSGEVISEATGNPITCKKCRGNGQVRASSV